jgi:hypothetical protein
MYSCCVLPTQTKVGCVCLALHSCAAVHRSDRMPSSVRHLLQGAYSWLTAKTSGYRKIPSYATRAAQSRPPFVPACVPRSPSRPQHSLPQFFCSYARVNISQRKDQALKRCELSRILKYICYAGYTFVTLIVLYLTWAFWESLDLKWRFIIVEALCGIVACKCLRREFTNPQQLG